MLLQVKWENGFNQGQKGQGNGAPKTRAFYARTSF